MTKSLNEELPSPSYGTACFSGVFLGLLGGAALVYLPAETWISLTGASIIGFLGALIGAYIAAEAYEELKTHYTAEREKQGSGARTDGAATVAASAGLVSVGGANSGLNSDLKGKLAGMKERLGADADRLARSAAELGKDGYKIAEAAEILRREMVFLSKEID